jgi:PIN domain nuclease of toxin-antitoxin system
MNILLDTQAIIWFAENNTQLSQTARNAIEDSENDCFVSMASFWEMSIKMNLGKLNINGLTLKQFMKEVSDNDFATLDIRQKHILENVELQLHHRDPFDRLIIAQAIIENMPIISSDGLFDAYPVTRIW